MGERARSVLAQTNYIACEDTRRAGKLLRLLGLDANEKQLFSFNVLNENEEARKIIASVQAGQDIAVISDAGTPLVSDPGFPLLQLAFDAGLNVVPIPGPSALTACLSACPLPMNDFRFVGFLERKRQAKSKQLQRLLAQSVPVVCFEAPVRILETLEVAIDLGFGERQVFIARELTKLHEEKIFATVQQVYAELTKRARVVGEFVVVFAASDDADAYEASVLATTFAAEGISPSAAARLIAQLTGLSRRDAYRLYMAKTATNE